MLARRAAAEVLAGDDDLVVGDELVGGVEGNVSLGQAELRGRHAGQGVLAELPVFLRDGRVQRQVLGRDDLVGINVVAQAVGLALDYLHCHGVSRVYFLLDHPIAPSSRYREWQGPAQRRGRTTTASMSLRQAASFFVISAAVLPGFSRETSTSA